MSQYRFTPKNLRPLLEIDIQNQSVPFVLGAPGIGKSAVMRQIAKDLDTKLFIVSANLLADKADLTGVTKIKLDDGSLAQSFYPHQNIQEAISYANEIKDTEPGKPVLLFLDEVNRAPEDVQTGLMSLSTERKIGNSVLPDNISIILAGNDSGNVNSVDSAMLSRTVVYRMDPSVDDLLASPAGQNLDPDVVAWLKKNQDNIFSQPILEEDDDNNGSKIDGELGEDFNQFTTPRTIEKLSDFIKQAKTSNVWKDLLDDHKISQSGIKSDSDSKLTAVVYAHIGHTPAADRFLDGIGATASAALVSFDPMVNSVLDVLANDSLSTEEKMDELTPQFQNDVEIAKRTMTGLLLNNLNAGIDPFKVDSKDYFALFEALGDVLGSSLTSLLTDIITQMPKINRISAMTIEELAQSNMMYGVLNSMLQSFITQGTITVE